jgi:hypothetical protein
MKIFIQSALSGNRINLEVNSNDTIEELKSNIYNLQSIGINDQTLIFCGIILEDIKTISEYKINDNSIIQLVIKSLGIPHKLPQTQIQPKQYYLDNMIDTRNNKAVNSRLEKLSSFDLSTSQIVNIPTTPITPIINTPRTPLYSPSDSNNSMSEFSRKNGPFKLKSNGTRSYCLCTIYVSEFKDDRKEIDFFRISYTWEYATNIKSDSRDCCWWNINDKSINKENGGNPFILLKLENQMSGLTIEKNDLSISMIRYLIMDDDYLEKEIRYEQVDNYRKSIMIALSFLNKRW